MPDFTFVHYNGSDEQIMELVSCLVAAKTEGQVSTVAKPNVNAGSASNTWSEVAQKFAKYVSNAASYGSPSQKNAMLAWLKSDGEILLTKLWKAAGVKVQHDYSGVGGSMTKNMMKAKGPRAWYAAALNSDGEWVYTIVPELVEPLKHSFGLK